MRNIEMESDQSHLFYWLAFLHLKHLSLKHKLQLLKQVSEPPQLFNREVIHALPLDESVKQQIEAVIMRKSAALNPLRACIDWLEKPGHHLITLADPRYPSNLKAIADPPLALFVKGDAELLSQSQLAIVGSRRATSGASQLARRFAMELAESGMLVSSGLALGIDRAAHEGCLASGGKTLAVMATGPERVYPARHAALAEQICEQGALVTEYPLGTAPLPGRFPQRNRIISGLSQGVLVVEAGLKSGSLITARLALEQGREVFAVPGSVNNPLAKGCNDLIRQGAKLTESIEDILEELQGIGINIGLANAEVQKAKLKNDNHPIGPNDPLEHRLWSSMEPDRTYSSEELALQNGLSIAEAMETLVCLEVSGWLASEPGGYQRLYSNA